MDWANLYKKYAGLWVALKDDEITVVAADHSAEEALRKSIEKGVQNPILNLIPRELLPMVG